MRMKQCPHCKASIEESSRFCLYCMSSFEEKKTVELSFAKKKVLWIVGAAVGAVLLLIVVAVLSAMPPKAPTSGGALQGTTTTSSVSGATSTPTSARRTTKTDPSVPNTSTTGTNAAPVIVPTANEAASPMQQTTDMPTLDTSTTGANTAPGTVSTANEEASLTQKTTVTTDDSTTQTTKKTVSGSTTKATTKVITKVTTKVTTKATTKAATTTKSASKTTTTVATASKTTAAAVQTDTYTYREAVHDDVYLDMTIAVPPDTVTITGIRTPAADGIYRVPNVIDGKRVVAIAADAFAGEDVRIVVLPANMATVNERAFTGCPNLTDIYYISKAIYTYPAAFVPPSQRAGVLTIHCAWDCSNRNFRYYRNIAADWFGADYQEWNGGDIE